MRTSREVKDELDAIIKEHQMSDSTEDILIGWTEALAWVLSEYKEE